MQSAANELWQARCRYTEGAMDLHELNENFRIPGVLEFTEHDGLQRAEITTPAASATLYLQGAHLTAWQPTGEPPVLFLSRRSEFTPGKAIRGGIPVIAPWFGPDTRNRAAGEPGPSHGFARAQPWTFAFAALVGEELHLTLTLGPTDLSRSLGYPDLRLAYQVNIGSTLMLQLTLANIGAAPMPIEEALHAYLSVGDVRQARLLGLKGTQYLDKMDEMRQKPETADALMLTGATDRVYLNTEATCVVEDPLLGRRLIVAKANSRSTVVWNPWTELTRGLKDMEPEGWVGMLCVETANAGPDTLSLGPGETHTMRATLSVERLDPLPNCV